ncbi:MAG: xanthine dehydrogenase family protein subunit M [Planctomycetota bacterium]|nr:MAG: xanthine dehydrogenase family protein subunit M [Planctomycetota bacterium]
MRSFEYVMAADAPQAVQLCGEGASKGKAGGIDLLDLMKEGLERPARVVGLQQALGTGVERSSDWVRLQAGITLAAIARDAELRREFPALAQAVEQAATPQLREMATLGGNLLQRPRCWYFRSRHYTCLKKGGSVCWAQNGLHESHALFDNGTCAVVHASNAAVALAALGASVVILGRNGTREVPLPAVYVRASQDPQTETTLQPGELITHVNLPRSGGGPRSAHYEVRFKQSFDWPLAMATVNLNGARPAVALGAVASVPLLRPELEADLRAFAAKAARDQADAIAAKAVAGATPLQGNAWRLPILKVTVRRALMKAAGIPEEQW